jgi:hypothetical protein
MTALQDKILDPNADQRQGIEGPAEELREGEATEHWGLARPLSAALAEVAEQGWNSAPGREAIEIMRRACRQEARHWTRTAGWHTDEGLATVWEQMHRLVQTGRFDDAPGLLRVVVKRAYRGEAAAAQTGVSGHRRLGG